MTEDRRGFTFVELLVVAVLGSLLVLASLQVLITNQRTYTAQAAQIKGQQSTRAAVDLLYNELRELSPPGGDLVVMHSTSLTVRSMRTFGVVCDVSAASPPVLSVLKVGDWFEQDDSVFVFADNNPSVPGDDSWVLARVTSVDTTAACGAQRAAALSFSGQAGAFTANTVASGAPVRGFVRYTYGVVTFDGASYLGRTGTGGTVPLVGPLDSYDGLSFAYLDTSGNTTTVPTDVRQIAVTVRTSSAVLNALGEAVSDSITAVIYTRN